VDSPFAVFRHPVPGLCHLFERCASFASCFARHLATLGGMLFEFRYFVHGTQAGKEPVPGLRIGGVVRAAILAADQQPMSLVWVRVQQDHSAGTADVINRIIARFQGWRGSTMWPTLGATTTFKGIFG